MAPIHNIRRRLQWLAREWELPPDELPEIKPCPTKELVDFCEKHHVCFNWLLGGNLKDLQQMVRGRPAAAHVPPVDRIIEK